jgi:thioredoxin 1
MNAIVTNENFKQLVMQKKGLSIVQFFSEWSGACQIMAPVYEELSNSYSSRAGFFSVDVDMDPLLKEQYGIMDLPTVLFFRDGNMVDHIMGPISKNAFIAKLENSAPEN